MSETQESTLTCKLKKVKIFNELATRCSVSPEYAELISLIQDIGNYSVDKSKTVIKNMPEFTLHDIEHFFDMFYIIEKLIPNETLKQLSIPDLMMIIICVFLHDIGMCPEENLIKAWKNQLQEPLKAEYQQEIAKFQRFRRTYIQEINEIDNLNQVGEYSKAQLLEERIITDYIRINHADRARAMIAADWEGKIKYMDVDLTSDVAEVCFSHNENYTELLNMESIKLCGEDTFLCLPFVAVILRLADIIDFDRKRTPLVLYSHLAIENPISLKEWNKHLSINSWSITSKSLILAAECNHPAIEATILKFCDLIDDELRNCTLVLANLQNDFIKDISLYKIQLPTNVDRRKIVAKKDIATGKPIYHYHDTKFTLSKRQVIDLLMGTKLYGKPEVALRELVQNSIDACLLRQKMSKLWGENYIPKITVSYTTKKNIDYLTVSDNGIGMNQHIVDCYYTNIGKSYYTSKEFYDLMADTQNTFKPISRFGIGILACFMVCDNMQVNTRKVLGQYQYDAPLKISIEGYDSLFIITESDRKEPGTDTTLQLRKTHPWNKMSASEFVKCIHKLVPLPPFEIEVQTGEINEIFTPEVFKHINLDLDDDYSWKKEDNVKILDIDLDSEEQGFRGKASIAYIVKNNIPQKSLETNSKIVFVEDDSYSLSTSISYGSNCINKNTTSLEIDEDGQLDSAKVHREITKSKSYLSVHGIDVPCNLFLDYTNYGQKAVLHFPFPVRLRIDIGETNDLNLNSARSQIIYDDTWLKFEKDLFQIVCKNIKANVNSKTWSSLKTIFIEMMKNQEEQAELIPIIKNM